MKPKRELVRIVRSPEGEVSVDLTGRKSGRGAYICRDDNCLKKSIKSKGLSRSLEVEIPETLYETLRQQMEVEQ
jgi:hypothetical protein